MTISVSSRLSFEHFLRASGSIHSSFIEEGSFTGENVFACDDNMLDMIHVNGKHWISNDRQ